MNNKRWRTQFVASIITHTHAPVLCRRNIENNAVLSCIDKIMTKSSSDMVPRINPNAQALVFAPYDVQFFFSTVERLSSSSYVSKVH